MKPSWLPENPFWNEPILGADKSLAAGFDCGRQAGAKAVLEYLRNMENYLGDEGDPMPTIDRVKQMLKEIE